jgi:UTP--glucose-1-phosphate uridylyltransferase
VGPASAAMGGVRKAVIPAAGLGTRLYPFTKVLPKEMLPLLNKPLIHYVVEEAVAAGVDDILIVVSRNKEALIDYFDKPPSGLEDNVTHLLEKATLYYVRQREALGLGDAIRYARKHVGDEPFAVLLGDTVFDRPVLGELVGVFMDKGCPVMGVERVDPSLASRYGIVEGEVRGDLVEITRMVEKPTNPPTNIAITGPYILTSEVFDYLERTGPGAKGEIQLTDALARYPRKLGYFVKAKRYDIGDVDSWLRANMELSGVLTERANTIQGVATPNTLRGEGELK